ncbi:pgdA [Symbiodinium sp. CCMP2592]|nr:pgdA [Symbiodinium sp. CCMP2592]
MCDMWVLDKEIQAKCSVYVRHLDRCLPYQFQRSCVNAVFHLERKGDLYFRSMFFMVFLVIIVSLCSLMIPLEDISGRLAHLSTCFLAIMAYRYIVGDMLPRKEYLTPADMMSSLPADFKWSWWSKRSCYSMSMARLQTLY